MRMNPQVLPLGLLVLSVVACATTGTFVAGPWYRTETLDLNDEGSFRYELWSDDGGSVCEAEGSWQRVIDDNGRKALVTKVASRNGVCKGLPDVEQWWFERGRLWREGRGPYRRK